MDDLENDGTRADLTEGIRKVFVEACASSESSRETMSPVSPLAEAAKPGGVAFAAENSVRSFVTESVLSDITAEKEVLQLGKLLMVVLSGLWIVGAKAS